MWADDPLTVSQMIAPCSEAVEDRGLREHVDSASDATTEETETIDEVTPPHSTVVLKERLNQRVAHFLVKVSQGHRGHPADTSVGKGLGKKFTTTNHPPPSQPPPSDKLLYIPPYQPNQLLLISRFLKT